MVEDVDAFSVYPQQHCTEIYFSCLMGLAEVRDMRFDRVHSAVFLLPVGFTEAHFVEQRVSGTAECDDIIAFIHVPQIVNPIRTHRTRI